MAWFLVVWASLAVSLGATAATVSIVIFHHLDLRYVTLVHLLVIPTAQALVVGWVRRWWSLSGLLRVARETLRHRIAATLVLLNAGVLASACLAAELPVGIGRDRGHVIAMWTGLQAAAAAIALVRAMARGTARRRQPWLLLLAVCALAVTAGLAIHWLGAPDPCRGFAPKTVRQLAGAGVLATVALLALVRSGAHVRDLSPLASFCFDVAAGCLFAMTLIGALNFSLHPFLAEPWSTVTTVLGSCCASGALIGSLLALQARESRADSK